MYDSPGASESLRHFPGFERAVCSGWIESTYSKFQSTASHDKDSLPISTSVSGGNILNGN